MSENQMFSCPALSEIVLDLHVPDAYLMPGSELRGAGVGQGNHL